MDELTVCQLRSVAATDSLPKRPAVVTAANALQASPGPHEHSV